MNINILVFVTCICLMFIIGKIFIEDIIKLCSNNIGNKYLTPNKKIKVLVKNHKIYFISQI